MITSCGFPKFFSPRTGVWALTVLVALGAWGCEDSQPASCLASPEGYFRFHFSRLGSGLEIFGITEITVTLQSMELQSLNPPLTRYVLREGSRTYWLDLQDLGYDLPLTPGTSYRMRVEHQQDEFLQTYGLLFEDDSGLRVLLESDGFADNNNPDFNYVFKDGYGDTGIIVRFNDPGCEARRINSGGYKEIFTWNLNFALGTEGRTLYHKEQAVLGPYTIRVVKSQREFINSGHEDLIAPQISWILMPTEDFGQEN